MHRNFGFDFGHVVSMLADRQTDTQTDMQAYSLLTTLLQIQ